MKTVARHEAKNADSRWIIAFAAGLAALLAVRIVALIVNATDLFFDEAQYWSWSLEPAFGYYSKPPMVAWVIGLATGVCGHAEFCVRLPSPLIHTATATVVFLVGRRLYDVRTGALAGLVFATLPGVSLSSGIISTDVPLLFFWAVALFSLAALLDTRAWWPAVLLGCALGLGLNAKYAMAWFGLCLGAYLIATPERRGLLRDPRLYLVLALAALLITPNLLWNGAHGFATFAHTADNAKWSGSLFNPLKAAEFFFSQFGVFGPILFAGLLVVAWRAAKLGAADPDRLLLSFSLPLVALMTLQAFVSRAHANWAAVSYVAASVLVTATLVRDLSWGWLKTSFGLHGLLVVGLALATATAGRLPLNPDPFARTLGWHNLAEATRAELERARREGRPYGAVLTDERSATAELLYYMRSEPTPVLAWRENGRPRDHYELTRPFDGHTPEPVLLVSIKRDPGSIVRAFSQATVVARLRLPAGRNAERPLTLYALSGYGAK